MMRRLSLLCLVFLSITFLPPNSEGCQYCPTTVERNGEMLQAENLVHVSPSSSPNATSSSEKTTSSRYMHPKLVSEHNKTSSIYAPMFGEVHSPDVGNDDLVVYFAAHSSFPGTPYNDYFGLVTTVDVYGYNLVRGQMSTFTIWVANMGGGSRENYNSIRVGWMVSPEIYGDSHTHFYIHWTGDGHGTTGCYNMDCLGFHLEKGSKIAPGDIIPHVSGGGGSRNTITFKVFKEKSTGYWWVYYGLNDDTPTAVGYYPANIFTGLAEKADEIAIGGESRAIRSLPTPPMGDGSLPSQNAASVGNLQFVDQDGETTPITSNLPIIAGNPKCYYVSPIVDAKFFYGGPAGCF